MENQLFAMNSASTDPNITSVAGILTMLGAKINAAAIVTNGSTNGSMTLYQPLQGIVKMAVIVFSGFRNNGGATQSLVLPVPFTGRSKMWCGAVPTTGVTFQLVGVNATVAVVTTLASGGGTAANVTSVLNISQGEILGGWDTMITPTGGTVVCDGVLLVIGT